VSELANDLGLARTAWAADAARAAQEAPLVVEALAEIAELLAEAHSELESAEAKYRHWRAIAMTDLVARYAKMSEWKARAEVEASPAYATHYETISGCKERVELLEGFRAALLEKSRLVSVLIGMETG